MFVSLRTLASVLAWLKSIAITVCTNPVSECGIILLAEALIRVIDWAEHQSLFLNEKKHRRSDHASCHTHGVICFRLLNVQPSRVTSQTWLYIYMKQDILLHISTTFTSCISAFAIPRPQRVQGRLFQLNRTRYTGWACAQAVSYTHLTLPTIYSV